MRVPRALAIVVALGLAGSACGARVPEQVRQHAVQRALGDGGAGGSSPDSSGGSSAPASSGPVTSGSAPPVTTTGGTGKHGSSPSGATVPTTAATQSAATPGASSAATAPAASQPSGCGTGTDVGLTASSITLGTVATLTGPVAGLFEGAEQGSETFAGYLNGTGGLCGRQVSVDAADDATNCEQNENVTQQLISKVFAFVGSFSLYDGCGSLVLRQHPTVPDIHVGLDPQALTAPNHFDLSTGEPGYATGMFHYYRQKYGSKVQHVGSIVENIPSAVANQKEQEHSAESQGWKFVDTIPESPTTGDFASDFDKLCQQQHIQVFFLLTEPAQNAATMMQDERQAGCPKSLINIVPIAYDQAFLRDFGSNASALNGLQGWSEYALFYNKDEAANIPEVKLLQSWFTRLYPGQPLNLYAMYAWASGRMFQQAVEHAGSVLDRKTVTAAIRKITNFSANGLVAPRNPGQKAGVHCYIVWQLENGAFERIDDPKSGFRCDGEFLPYK